MKLNKKSYLLVVFLIATLILTENYVVIFVFIGIVLSLLFVKQLLIAYKKTTVKKDLENTLTEEILKLTTINVSGDIKRIINSLTLSRNKTISNEFLIIKRKIMQGHNINNLFEVLKKKYNSDILDKFLNLIIISYKTGTTSQNDFKNLVDDFLRSKQIMQERNSMLLMQKYTIVFSGTIIIPIILGVVISLVEKLQSSIDLSYLGFEINNQLFFVGYYCAIIYIVEYIIISSVYLATIENNTRKFIIYLLIFLPVGLCLFFVAPHIF
jgi:hypothetical protein